METMRTFGLGALTVTAIALAFLVAAGCGGPGPETPEPAAGAAVPAGDETPAAQASEGDPEDGDWLVSLLPAEMEHLNPFTTSDAYASRINGLIFETLLEVDNATLTLKPLLAAALPEVSEDKLTYTFRLREDARFSDGKPLTAHDVRFSYDTLMDPATNAPHARNYYQDIVACEVLDDYTVRFTCKQPYFRHVLVIGGLEVIPRHVYSEGDFNTHANNRNPIGSGPYTMGTWKTGQQLTLVRNENYWGEKPHISKRVYKIITNDDAAFQVLARGEMDTMGLQPEKWVNQAAKPAFEEKFNKFSYYSPSYMYIGYNMRRPVFSDKRVRQALTMLLDRELILEEIFYGLGRITTGNFFVDEPEYNKAIEPWPFDPERAKKQLDKAGWSDTDGDGVRDKDGVPFDFEIRLTNNSVEAEQIATIFQEELKRAGIVMTIRQLEWATYLQSVKEHEYDASMLGWSLGIWPDPYQLWHSSQAVKNGSNTVGFVNEEADRIIEAGRLEFDHEKRIAMYHRFHEIVHEEQPYTFLFCRKALVTVDKRFRNTTVYPLGMDSEEWWVPAALQRYK
jgi:peptide/nickel transport system substrate-binding protein